MDGHEPNLKKKLSKNNDLFGPIEMKFGMSKNWLRPKRIMHEHS